MRPTNRNWLQAHFRRSHDDLYQIIKAHSFPTHDLFLEQAIEVDKPDTIAHNMPRTLPISGPFQPLRRRPSSEPISITNCHLSYDHEMARQPSTTTVATTGEGHLTERIRQLTERGVPICGSPMKANFLENYQPADQLAQSRSSSPASSLSSSVDIDGFSFISDSSSSSTSSQLWFNDGEEHDEQDLQSTEFNDQELQFDMELEENYNVDYRRLFTSITNIPHLLESTMTAADQFADEDAIDSSSTDVTLDQAIVNHQVPRLEVDSPEVEAERRLQMIRQVAAELRQISLDYEHRVQQRNVTQRNEPIGDPAFDSPLKHLLLRLHQFALSKLHSLKRFLQTVLAAAFGQPPRRRSLD